MKWTKAIFKVCCSVYAFAMHDFTRINFERLFATSHTSHIAMTHTWKIRRRHTKGLPNN